MQRYLGDILVRKGYINTNSLEYALNCQIKKLLKNSITDTLDIPVLMEIARSKYNKRNDYLLGKILTELKLTEEKRIEEALLIQQKSKRPLYGNKMAVLNQILSRINSTYNLIDLLNKIMVYACSIVKAESSSFVIYDHAKDKLVILIPTGPHAEAVKELKIPPEEGIVGWVYTHDQSLIVNNVHNEKRFYNKVDKISGYRTEQILCVPLRVKGRLIGVLEVINKVNQTKFNKNDQLLLEIFAEQSGIAIENTRLYYQASKLTLENEKLKSKVPVSGQKIDTLHLIARSYLNDLKTALIPVSGYTELIRSHSNSMHVKKYASFIDNELNQITGKTEDILQFTREELLLSRKRIKITEIIEGFMEQVWPDCRLHRINIEVTADKEIEITVDYDKLIRCFIHLLNNSMDAMPQGGLFRIKVFRNKNNQVVITLTDSGTGIDEEVMDNIFDPLFSHKRKHGSGMGLSICRQIIKAHGGSITAGNATEGGTVINIYLPA